MQFPIDILPQMMNGASSGAEIRQRAGPGFRENSQFAKVIEEAIAKKNLLPMNSSKPRETEPVYGRPVVPEKPDSDPDETLAAGAMADQYLIVSILEGDKESAATPETQIHADATAIADNEAAAAYLTDANHNETGVKPGQQTAEQFGIDIENAAVNRTDAQEVINASNNAKSAGAEDAQAHTEANVEAAAKTGEVTARMPVKTTEQQDNKETISKSSENGNLSPLENENDSASIKEQPKSSSSDTEQKQYRDTKDLEQPLSNAAAPLAEGIRPERFKADQQMKQASLDAPVKAENLFEEMISRIDSMKTDTLRSMTIQLKPEFLGKVALEFAVDAAGLHVRIDAANSDVRAMINGQINALIESLQQKGIAVVEVEVTHTGIDNGAFKESGGGQAHSGKSRNKYRDVSPVERAEYYTALPLDAMEYYLDTGVSSVEYRA